MIRNEKVEEKIEQLETALAEQFRVKIAGSVHIFMTEKGQALVCEDGPVELFDAEDMRIKFIRAAADWALMWGRAKP